jgi:hypothetical protein
MERIADVAGDEGRRGRQELILAMKRSVDSQRALHSQAGRACRISSRNPGFAEDPAWEEDWREAGSGDALFFRWGRGRAEPRSDHAPIATEMALDDASFPVEEARHRGPRMGNPSGHARPGRHHAAGGSQFRARDPGHQPSGPRRLRCLERGGRGRNRWSSWSRSRRCRSARHRRQ